MKLVNPWEYILSRGHKVMHPKLCKLGCLGSFLQVLPDSTKNIDLSSQIICPADMLLYVLAETPYSVQFRFPKGLISTFVTCMQL